MSRNGLFFILVGPSGAGKNTVMDYVLDHMSNLKQQPTMTTRPMRSTEQEGREHYFVSLAGFQEALANEQLLESEQVHLEYWYGTPRYPVEEALDAGQDRIADIECKGATKVKAAFPDHAVFIFVTPSSLDILKQRIIARGDITPQELTERLKRARFELAYAPRADYILINDEREDAYNSLYRIILTERNAMRGTPLDASPEPEHLIAAHAIALIRSGEQILVRTSEPLTAPSFALRWREEMPHARLIAELEDVFDQTPVIHSDRDDRFEFPAPNHVIISGTAPQFSLNFFYEVEIRIDPAALPDGWQWQSITRLNLPQALETPLHASN